MKNIVFLILLFYNYNTIAQDNNIKLEFSALPTFNIKKASYEKTIGFNSLAFLFHYPINNKFSITSGFIGQSYSYSTQFYETKDPLNPSLNSGSSEVISHSERRFLLIPSLINYKIYSKNRINISTSLGITSCVYAISYNENIYISEESTSELHDFKSGISFDIEDSFISSNFRIDYSITKHLGVVIYPISVNYLRFYEISFDNLDFYFGGGLTFW
ncbi:MAG: hypothetical protein A2046_08995 [Bacteroidetes bacterium GWA2_30_7]|nr:MAG: hypothetical protein A2046_08995 [Bacteroidetes bacterium GWA2_30_7]